MNRHYDPRSYAGFRMAAFGAGLRIGDAERNATVQQLNEHYAAGRLTNMEHDERVDFAMGAKTQADLQVLLADLPPVAGFGHEPASHRHWFFAGPLIGTLIMIAVVGLVFTTVIAVLKALPVIFLILLGLLIARRIRRRRWARGNYGGWGGQHNW